MGASKDLSRIVNAEVIILIQVSKKKMGDFLIKFHATFHATLLHGLIKFMLHFKFHSILQTCQPPGFARRLPVLQEDYRF